MLERGTPRVLAGGDRQGDPVGDVEPGFAAGLLDRADEVTGGSLEFQVESDLRVEDHEATAGQHRGHVCVRTGLLGDDRLERVLALDERQPTGGDRAVLGHGPVTALGALDDGLHVLAQTRAGDPRIDGELLADPEVRLVGRVDIEQGDRLDVELVGDDRRERLERRRVGRHHGQSGQRQPHPQVLGLAQRGPDRTDGARPVHRGDEGVVGGQVGGRRPVGEVHRPPAGETTPDLLRHERQQRCGHPGEHLQRRVEGVERLVCRAARRALGVGRRAPGTGVPEAFPAPPDVPVGEHVDELAHALAGAGNVIDIELGGGAFDQLVELGEQIAVERVGRRGRPLRGIPLPTIHGVGVEGEEVPRVPQRHEHLADALADALLGDDQVAAPQDARVHEEPAHRVGPVAVEHLVDVGVVAQRLAHLLAVVAEDDAVADDRLERRPVEQGRREDVQGVEPAARLADVLDDEVAGEVVLEPVGVLEGVVDLRERHRAGVEPHVEHVLHAAHRGRPARVIGVGTGQLVDERSVQVRLARSVQRQPAEVGLELGEGAVDVDPRELRVVRLPHRHRAPPEPVAGDRPVAGVLQPLAELAVLDVLGHPGDLLVELDHAVLERRDLDEPARHTLVDQRLPAAPAVGVGVVIGLAAQQHRPRGD